MDIPQLAGEPTALLTACSSGRNCTRAYPVALRGGLLWVWPDAGPRAAAEAAAAGARAGLAGEACCCRLPLQISSALWLQPAAVPLLPATCYTPAQTDMPTHKHATHTTHTRDPPAA